MQEKIVENTFVDQQIFHYVIQLIMLTFVLSEFITNASNAMQVTKQMLQQSFIT